MATKYSITINMDQPTVDKLRSEKWSLYGFKAVRAPREGGKPLVWFSSSSNTFLQHVEVSWIEKYEAYIATGSLQADVQIKASSRIAADLGDIVAVSATGGLTVARGGDQRAITIENIGDDPYIGGISQQQPAEPHGKSDEMTPLCGFPLHGHTADVIAPIESVLLMFSRDTVKTATVVEKAYGQGALFDLTEEHAVTVAYSIDGGWRIPKDVRAEILAFGTDLVPRLIVEDKSLQQPR